MNKKVESFLMSERLRGRQIKQPISPKDCYEFYIPADFLWFGCCLVFSTKIVMLTDSKFYAKTIKEFYEPKYNVIVELNGSEENMFELAIKTNANIIVEILSNIENDVVELGEYRQKKLEELNNNVKVKMDNFLAKQGL